ncbi:MAG TPA: glycoside hydrolase family 92 protein, partial [Flavobacteriales bacterium]|nr:glycoside hydrolase family 92 protein [Flavobacteriales bacterium]
QDHFAFGDLGGEPLVAKVGISAVSIEGARRNLEAEVPGWDFDAVRAQAGAAWNAKLDKVRVEGGTREQQRNFFTALYHSYVSPYVFNDVDGHYRGMDGQVHHADHDVYTVFSLWDTFRALHPLMTILEPEMTNDFIRTMLLHYQDGGRLPVWELWGNETDCMIGYHSVSVIADAYLKGLRDYDADLALEAMVASAMGEDPCLEAYRKQGYISSEDCAESVSKTLEYAYDDWCIAQMAREMGRDSLAEVFHRRSGNWRNLFDPETKFFRARRNGGFIDPFDPYEVNFHFTEANAWQYSLFAPQAIDELAACMGGPDSLEAQLDRLFTASIATTGREQADITGLIGQYAHGNEPSHHMAYLYSWLGKHDKARHYLDRILNELYQDGPAGLSGNEDCGQMSAWYVLSSLGMYPIAFGDGGRYDLGGPLFESIQVQVNDTTTWSMSATELDGLIGSKGKPMVRHESIMQGSKPGPIARSTVLDGAYLCTTAPVIVAPAASFSDALEVTAKGTGTCTITDASGTRPCPMNAPFTLTATSTVAVDWSEHYAPVTAHFTRFDSDLKITLDSEYANQYAAGGDGALIDGIRGGADFRTGAWQGYQGQDVTFT